MPRRPKVEWIPGEYLLPIVGDGAIASQIAEGVLIPLLIVDTSERPDIAEVIRVHKHLAPGDVRFMWGGIQKNPQDVLLILDFERPIETRAVLRFNIETQAILVEAALTAKALYLQQGQPGDHLSDDPGRPKLLIELPDVEFREKWDQLFREQLTAVLSRRLNRPRKQVQPQVEYAVNELRRLTAFRMPQR